MRAVFINLDRAGDRRRFMERQFEALGLPVERFSAIDAAAVPDADLERLGRAWERPLSKPELCCFLSHRALWQRVAADGRPMLILEDDALLSPRLATLWPLVDDLGGMDVLNLEDFDRRRFVAPASEPLTPGFQRVKVYRDKAGAAAYILWPSGAEKLLARERRSGAAPADAFLHSARLAAWQCEPALAIQAEVLARRGLGGAFLPETSVQAPRRKLPLTLRNLPFVARRVRTQIGLVRYQASRLAGAKFRRIDIDPADFADQSASDHTLS